MSAARRSFRGLLLAATLAVGAACGGEGEGDATQSPPSFGPTPALGGHVLAVFPEHGASIAQAATKTVDPTSPQPPCFSADFTGLAEQAQWFRVKVDGVEVTPKLTWVVPSNPRPGATPRGCFATAEGLSVGRHTVTVLVRDPRDAKAADRQVVSWSFDVLR